jgi:predicted nuclease of predicted toxin-antitoxin system
MSWMQPEYPSKREIGDRKQFYHEHQGKARFLVDENMFNLTEELRRAGLKVKDVSEVGIQCHEDEAVFAFAKRENLILLTHDKGFLDDKRYPLHKNPGIIVLPGAEGNVSALLYAINKILCSGYRGIYRDTKISITGDDTITFKSLTESGVQITRFRFSEHQKLEIWIED